MTQAPYFDGIDALPAGSTPSSETSDPADEQPAGDPIDSAGVILFGGFGRQVGVHLHALAVNDGREVPMLAFDNDHRRFDPILGPDSEPIHLPASTRSMIAILGACS